MVYRGNWHKAIDTCNVIDYAASNVTSKKPSGLQMGVYMNPSRHIITRRVSCYYINAEIPSRHPGLLVTHNCLIPSRPYASLISMTAQSTSSREQIFDLTNGKSVIVPDLQAMMAHWPMATNSNLEILEKATTDRFEWIFLSVKNQKRLQKMKNSQVALFASMWWPYAPIQALYTMTWLSIWLFVWDDEIDSAEFADLVNDFDRASNFRCQTLRFIRESLKLHDDSSPHGSVYSCDSIVSPASENIIIHNFEDVGRAVSEFGNGRLSARFYEELEVFVKMTELEQKVHLSSKLPTVGEYLERRMGSSGVHVCLALTE